MSPHEYLLSDTDPEAERVLIRLAREAPPWKKCEQIVAATMACRELAMVGLRGRYPEANEEELVRRLAAVVLDREDVIRVYGWDPKIEGY